MRYVINAARKVVGRIEFGEVNMEDLASRGERIVEGPFIADLNEAKYSGGVIIQVPVPPVDPEFDAEQKLIYHQMYEDAVENLKKKGVPLPAHDKKKTK